MIKSILHKLLARLGYVHRSELSYETLHPGETVWSEDYEILNTSHDHSIYYTVMPTPTETVITAVEFVQK